MSLRSRRCLQLLLPIVAVMCLSAAPQQQLNPTVKVLPAATSTVPPECEEGLAPQPRPRVTAEEKIVARQIAAPPELQAPPTNDLRTTLRDVQTAAERNDRASFVDALARVKPILAGYPSGGERTAAEKAVAVYNDTNTVWDYQLTPAGAFFDASTNLFKMLSAYPGYDAFIRRQVLVDQAGARFYPSSESRAFLTQIAAARLKDIGIKPPAAAATAPAVTHEAPASVAREKKVVVHETAPKSAQATTVVPTPRKRHTTSAMPKTHHAAKSTVSRSKPVQVAEAKPATTKKPAEATTVKKSTTVEKTAAAPTKKTTAPETKIAPSPTTSTQLEKAVTPTAPTATQAATRAVSETPVPAPSTTATTSAPTATVASSDTAASATTATMASEPASSATATDTTATSATADTASTDTTGTGEKEQSGRPGEPRNLLWPIILIVVGVGVLILLFRTSPGGK